MNKANETDEEEDEVKERKGMHLHYARHYELHGQNDPVSIYESDEARTYVSDFHTDNL